MRGDVLGIVNTKEAKSNDGGEKENRKPGKKGQKKVQQEKPSLLREFVNCYQFARFFHGSSVIEEVQVKGLLISQSLSPLGAADPLGPQTADSGPIYLAMDYDAAASYGGNDQTYVARVFLDFERASTRRPPPETFEAGNRFIYIDRDNPSAVLTMADIPPEAIYRGTLTDLLEKDANADKLAECLRCIKSYSTGLPELQSELAEIMKQCVAELLLMDDVQLDKRPEGARRFPIMKD